jgi:hypothetical protein
MKFLITGGLPLSLAANVFMVGYWWSPGYAHAAGTMEPLVVRPAPATPDGATG